MRMKSGKASIRWIWVETRLLIPELSLLGIIENGILGPAVPALASSVVVVMMRFTGGASVSPLLPAGTSLLFGCLAILLKCHQLLLLCLFLGLLLGLLLFLLLLPHGLLFLARESWEVAFGSDHDASRVPNVPSTHTEEHRYGFEDVEEDFLCRENGELVFLRALGEFCETVDDTSLSEPG